jgi:spore germination protein YaaH
VPDASSTPTVLVQLSQAIPPGLWRALLDGRVLPVPELTHEVQQLAIRVPGPLAIGSRHTLQIFAAGAQTSVRFQVAPALKAEVSMRLADLVADQPASVDTTVHFSRPVSDRVLAQDLTEVAGTVQQYRWDDPQTLEVLATGFAPGSVATATVDDGIKDVAGAWTTAAVSASLQVPADFTHVQPSQLVDMYFVNSDDARASFFAHLNQIDMLSPQWYEANADGSITGSAVQDIIDAAHANHIQLVPLVMNANVDSDVAHAILADPGRRASLVANLLREAKTYGYAGFQVDFEHVMWTDRDLLTALVDELAATFHAAGLSVSVAVIPRLPNDDKATGAMLDYYHEWSGAYDFAALARAADFLAFMTYDEHNGVTDPGPVSGIPWMRAALEFSLQGVPRSRATLGLPTYYHDWVGGDISSSSYSDALTLASLFGVTPSFDAVQDEMHFTYAAGDGVHTLWYESGDTLRRKIPLLYEYGLRGISVWRAGLEDPAFWNVIAPRR